VPREVNLKSVDLSEGSTDAATEGVVLVAVLGIKRAASLVERGATNDAEGAGSESKEQWEYGPAKGAPSSPRRSEGRETRIHRVGVDLEWVFGGGAKLLFEA
jgi:hypothetical protein